MKLITILGLAALSVVAISLSLHMTGVLTYEMIKDPGYRAWARTGGSPTPEYVHTFNRDFRFSRRFIGRTVDAIRPLFPDLTDGSGYDKDSYRSRNIQDFPGIQYYAGHRIRFYWLSGSQNESGYFAFVVDDKIVMFSVLKG